MKPPVTKISLNEEQTKKFLSFFVKEALEIAKRKQQEQKAASGS